MKTVYSIVSYDGDPRYAYNWYNRIDTNDMEKICAFLRMAKNMNQVVSVVNQDTGKKFISWPTDIYEANGVLRTRNGLYEYEGAE